MRWATALAVIAVAWAGAVYLHQRSISRYCPNPNIPTETYLCDAGYHPSWQDPTAVGIAIGGLAIAAGILTARRRNVAKPS